MDRNTRLAAILVVVFVAMVGVAFAAVPFYRAFCQATGLQRHPQGGAGGRRGDVRSRPRR